MIRMDQTKFYIEGFIDVIEIEKNKILYLYKTYSIELKGSSLIVKAYSKKEMIVEGNIISVSYKYDK